MTDVQILGLDMFCPLGAGNVPILGKGKGTHVVLVNDIGRDGVTLSLEEMLSPEDIT